MDPSIAPYIYPRYIAEYGATPHNREIPLYFAMQLYAEFILHRDVDYGSYRPGGGYGVGRMAVQVRERGHQATRLPPALRHGQPYMVPFSDVQSFGVQLSQEATDLVRHVAEQYVEVRLTSHLFIHMFVLNICVSMCRCDFM